jgi:hypothetical protein
MPGLPRTNNELESHFRDTGRRLLRTTGQKGLTQRTLNAKALGNSSRAPQQRPKYWGPCAKLPLRIWLRNGSALLCIANGSACRVDPFDRPKRNSINYVRGGRRYSLQAQGDFRGIATLRCNQVATVR